MNERSDIAVLHNVPTWLNLTENWIYTQVISLPSQIENHIYCDTTLNLDRFGISNIWCESEQPLGRRYWHKVRRRLLFGRIPLIQYYAMYCNARLLHSHFGPTGWRNVGVARRLQIPHLVTFYGYDVNYLPNTETAWRTRYRELFESVDAVLCEGPHMAGDIVALGCPETKVCVHHLGVAIDDIDFRPRTWDGRGPLRVLLCGTFVEKKGYTFALAALGKIRDQIDIEVTIIGDARREPRSLSEKSKILRQIGENGLASCTRLLGYQPHSVMLDEAYKHHVLLAPSVTAADGDSEGGAPVTIIELAASGMPVISTTHCDIPEVITHGKSGLLAAERDVEQLAGHLKRLTENPEAWSQFTSTARKHIEGEYNAKIQGQRLGAIYRDIAGRGQRS